MLLALVVVAAVSGAAALYAVLASRLWPTSRAECRRLSAVPRLMSPPGAARRR